MQKKVTEFSTDAQNEFLDNFHIMTDFYQKFKGDNKSEYYKRTILSLHMTLQSLFILFLDRISSKRIGVRKKFISEDNKPQTNINLVTKQAGFVNKDLEFGSNELIVELNNLKGEPEETEKKKIRDNIYNNQAYDIINDGIDIANFKELRDRVKTTTNGKYGFNINMTQDQLNNRDKVIELINKRRNNFIHFEPHHHIFLSSDFDLGKRCLEIIEHIISNGKINNKRCQMNTSVLFIYKLNSKQPTQIKQEIIESINDLRSL